MKAERRAIVHVITITFIALKPRLEELSVIRSKLPRSILPSNRAVNACRFVVFIIYSEYSVGGLIMHDVAHMDPVCRR
jgi:hypothetical protein